MGKEIERKFLVKNDNFKQFCYSKYEITQGYLVNDGIKNIRVRKTTHLDGKLIKGYITVKSCNAGMTRDEFEYEISPEDAEELFNLCSEGILTKTRHNVALSFARWEVDEFEDGLIIAEIELENEKSYFQKPDWLGEEVTHDKSYYNSELVKRDI